MSLAEELRARIEREGPVTTRDFMAAALSAYYARGPDIGARGDFYTASNVSLFPRALARFVQAALARMEGARVVELGAGRGELAKALGVDVTTVEPMAGMAEAQAARGLRVVPGLSALPPAPTVFLANEVLDALPAHRVLGTAEGPREMRVAWRSGRFVEEPGPLSDRLRQVDLQVPPGAIREVNLEARALLAAMAAAAPIGMALFLDYAAGPPKPGGTLRGFHEHRVTDALERPGEQDITADVDFAQVGAFARAAGWTVLGERPQGEFLADLGLLDDMMAAMARGDTDAYMAGKNLLMPGGMGERFRVLLLGRGVAADGLPGFRPAAFPGGARG